MATKPPNDKPTPNDKLKGKPRKKKADDNLPLPAASCWELNWRTCSRPNAKKA